MSDGPPKASVTFGAPLNSTSGFHRRTGSIKLSEGVRTLAGSNEALCEGLQGSGGGGRLRTWALSGKWANDITAVAGLQLLQN